MFKHALHYPNIVNENINDDCGTWIQNKNRTNEMQIQPGAQYLGMHSWYNPFSRLVVMGRAVSLQIPPFSSSLCCTVGNTSCTQVSLVSWSASHNISVALPAGVGRRNTFIFLYNCSQNSGVFFDIFIFKY